MPNKYTAFLFLFILATCALQAQEDGRILPSESDYYKIITLPIPQDIVLEVGGLVTLPNGSLAASTRHGEVWIIEDPYMEGGAPYFRRFASGLHEILGLAYQDGAFYMAQRGELTKLVDENGDGRADRYETVYAWPLSGHYHEYSFGPVIAPDGSFFVTANVAFGDQGLHTSVNAGERLAEGQRTSEQYQENPDCIGSWYHPIAAGILRLAIRNDQLPSAASASF
ncbi:MAG TPA: hypothetical protein PLU64_19190, partial [Saprospiraceae bacterium]|nr:hypothetical protein [Saprospiraceae bacterium]